MKITINIVIFALLGILILLILLVPKPNPYDLNKDGTVDIVDMSILIANFDE